jgi:hypothetical protein
MYFQFRISLLRTFDLILRVRERRQQQFLGLLDARISTQLFRDE